MVVIKRNGLHPRMHWVKRNGLMHRKLREAVDIVLPRMHWAKETFFFLLIPYLANFSRPPHSH